MSTAEKEREWDASRLADLTGQITPEISKIVTSYTKVGEVSLFHYTDQSGFLGIIKNSELWASDLRHMNDTTEIAYGVGLWRRAVIERTKQEDDDEVKQILALSLRLGFIMPVPAMPSTHAVCFCRSPAVLSQWRHYARSDGYVLEFDSEELLDKTTARSGQVHVSLGNVIYSQSTQSALVASVIEKICLWLKSKDFMTVPAKDRLQIGPALLHGVCVSTAAFLKSPIYEPELECRLFAAPVPLGSVDALDFRSSDSGLVPYVKLVSKAPHLPIRRVHLGPSHHLESKQSSAQLVLRRFGYMDTEIVDSGLVGER